ncbi:MAG: sigma-70 family RNA polymerase sigma factor [Oscillospiraceae bacterium]|nr:sigma-70 family RNA polymerase sigma factor [Oscillospiraceae bacterium]
MDKIKLTATVMAAQTGDNAALETLYREYAKPVYFLALKILANKEDAEDITQEVFIHMFQKVADLKNPETFPTWLNRMTSNKCTDFLRKRKITLNIDDEEIAQSEFFEESDPLLVPEKSLDNAETVKIITDIIDGLPLPQRLCVYYYYYEHLTIAQIAENLETNESTVKNRLALAREKIRKAIETLEKREGIKLYGVAPLMITPILFKALRNFEMPQGLAESILGNVNAEAATVTEVPTDTVTEAPSDTGTVTEYIPDIDDTNPAVRETESPIQEFIKEQAEDFLEKAAEKATKKAMTEAGRYVKKKAVPAIVKKLAAATLKTKILISLGAIIIAALAVLAVIIIVNSYNNNKPVMADNEDRPRVTTEKPATTDTPDVTTTTPTDTTTPLSTAEPNNEELTEEEIDEIENYIRNNTPAILSLPYFDDITKINLTNYFDRLDLHSLYRDNKFEIQKAEHSNLYSFTPQVFEDYICTHINPMLSIEDFKYQEFYDSERDKIEIHYFQGTLVGGYSLSVEEVYRIENKYYVTLKDVVHPIRAEPFESDFGILTIIKNENGNFNILSRIPGEEIPEPSPPETTPTEPIEYISINLNSQGITDEILAQYVADGTIPQNVMFLHLFGNQITDISPLSGLTNLRHLSLSYNQITDISALSGMTNMTTLNLDRNQITDISPLHGLINLEYLSVQYNSLDNKTEQIQAFAAALPNYCRIFA